MQQELRFASFNAFNLAPPGAKLYDNLEPLTVAQYEAKLDWTAQQLDLLDADLVGFQEIFSQATLRAVLARSRRYRDAALAGFDAHSAGERLAPSVALVSRLPLARPADAWPAFPDGVALPQDDRHGDHPEHANRFARAPLHARVVLPGGREIDVVVVHLKSRRPDYRGADDGADPLALGLAHLRSLVWRGTEAVALRVLLTRLGRETRRPRIVLGDFNDIAGAVTTGIVLGAGAMGEPGRELADRLFDSNAIQLRQDQLRHAGYSTIHEGQCMTIDHILVSEEFNPASRRAIGAVVDVSYLNDHLLQQWPHASDHGQVLARIRLYGEMENGGAGDPATLR